MQLPRAGAARRTISSPKRACCAAGRRIVYGEVYVRSGEKIVAHATLDFLNSYPEEKPKKGVSS